MSPAGPINPPAAVREIAEVLERAGYETWCVGGAVRDAMLGHQHLDWDLATAATPGQVQRLFRRTVPVGIRFGTVGVLDRAGRLHEVTTFRQDVETDGRHAVVRFGASLDEDLARRDFTINAMAYSPSRDVIHDPFDGQGDLTRRLVRAVGDPADRMREDRLRALRGIRFASRFGFELEEATWGAIVGAGPALGRLSPERVRQEIEKTMEQVRHPSEAFALWQRSGAFRSLIPSLADADRTALAPLDCLPMPALARRPQRRINRIAALFLHVPRDQLVGALRDLTFSNSDVAYVRDLVDAWQRIGPQMTATLAETPSPPAATLRRWAGDAGRLTILPLLRIASAAWAARRADALPAPQPWAVGALYRRAVQTIHRDPLTVLDLAVDGSDLQKAGIAPGPLLGKILRALLDVVIDDPAHNNRDELIRRALALSKDVADPEGER